jgi:hypothetical protein
MQDTSPQLDWTQVNAARTHFNDDTVLDHIYQQAQTSNPTFAAKIEQAKSLNGVTSSQILDKITGDAKQMALEKHQAAREAEAKAQGTPLPENDPRMNGVKQGVVANLPGAVASGVKSYVKNVGSDYMDAAKNITANDAQFAAGKKSDLSNKFQGVGEVAKSVFAPINEVIKPAVNQAADALSNTPDMKEFADSKAGAAIDNANIGVQQKYQSWAKAHPEAAKNLEATVNIAQLLAAPEGESTVKGATSNVAREVGAGVKNLATDVGSKVAEVPGSMKAGLQDHYVNQASSEWAKPTTIAKPAYNKATDIYKAAKANGHDIGNTLVKNKISPADHIENGTYTTTETADKIRADAAKMSKEVLRPSLEKADLAAGTPKVSVDDVIKQAKTNIQKNPTLTAENKAALISKLDETGNALKKQHGEGMGLADLHDEKITRDFNSKYSPVDDIATNNEAIKNKAVADAARKLLEKNAPSEIPVKDFNAELQKQYQAANYLDALNGKKAPVSVGAKMRQTAGKVVGAAVGSSLGGGVLGGVGGYHLGGMVESLLENIRNPLKTSLLKNLEATNPEAFAKVQDYLNTH